MDTTPHILPDDLLELRQELGLTQAQMADKLGMTWRNYQSLETGNDRRQKLWHCCLAASEENLIGAENFSDLYFNCT